MVDWNKLDGALSLGTLYSFHMERRIGSGERHQPGVPVNPQLLKIYDAATKVDSGMDAWILFL